MNNPPSIYDQVQARHLRMLIDSRTITPKVRREVAESIGKWKSEEQAKQKIEDELSRNT